MNTRQQVLGVAVVLAACCNVGCAERSLIRSEPAGAAVYVNDNLLGITPVWFEASRSEIGKTFRYRMEKDGYVTEDGLIRKAVAPGRIFGYIFTVGIFAVIRGPVYLKNVDAVLEPVGVARRDDGGGSVEQRLRHLDRAYADGVITEQEYHRLRASLMQDF